MKNLTGSVLLLCSLPFTTLASSHREAPGIAKDPVADNTDLYAWVKPSTHDTVYIIANYNPLQEPSGGPNFHGLSDDVLYQIHIARGPTSLDDVVTYEFRFKTAAPPYVDVSNQSSPPGGGKEFFLQLAAANNAGGVPLQTYTVTKVVGTTRTVIASNVKVAPPNIGTRTFQLVYTKQYNSTETDYTDAFAASFVTAMSNGEGKVFVGPRDDGFYVDLGGIFDLAGLRPKGTAQDGVAGYNVSSIVLEIPSVILNGGTALTNGPSDAQTLGIWASASRRQVRVLHHDGDDDDFGPWVQVSRLGLPLINEAVIGLQDKDKWNRKTPKDDLPIFAAYFLNPILVRDAQLAGLYMSGGPLMGITPPAFNRGDIIDVINLKNIPTGSAHNITSVGDVLRVDMGMDPGFPSGRSIPGGTNKEGADVTDVMLSLLLTRLATPVSDGVDYNDKTFLTGTPWLALPWRGSDQGHGKPTP
jgi:hypothetical protein